MAQVKIYGQRDYLAANRSAISNAIHGCLVEAFGLPVEKRFQRFVGLADEDFIYPDDRSAQYIIIEIVMFEGRSPEAKRRLIQLLYKQLQASPGMTPIDIEIVLLEAPRSNWGIRGKPGDEIGLPYKVDI